MKKINTIKIENENDYVRDTNSKALLNTNLKALHANKKRIENQKQINNDINNMKVEINQMKNIQQEILEIVKKYR